MLGVIFLDLDRFKDINDSLGHNTGDMLVQHLAKRLGDLKLNNTWIARLGGDEFTILVYPLDSLEEMANIAKLLLEVVAKPFLIKSYELQTKASIGIAVYPQHGVTATDIMQHADVAMYHAKEKGGGRPRNRVSSDLAAAGNY